LDAPKEKIRDVHYYFGDCKCRIVTDKRNIYLQANELTVAEAKIVAAFAKLMLTKAGHTATQADIESNFAERKKTIEDEITAREVVEEPPE